MILTLGALVKIFDLLACSKQLLAGKDQPRGVYLAGQSTFLWFSRAWIKKIVVTSLSVLLILACF